jgi:hypothetical protein
MTMTPDQRLVEEIKAEIAKLPPERQAHIEKISGGIRSILKAGGADASIALALVGAEEALDA